MRGADFIAGFREFIEGGLDEENKARFRLAITAYFKALIQICDFIILKDRGFAPKNHDERFRVLERYFPPVYPIVDDLFSLYRKTYTSPMDKEACKVIRNGIRKVIDAGKLGKELEDVAEKLSK